MLNPGSADLIRATLPAVGAAIEDITVLFYRRLFEDHPTLERDLFNRGNQAQGDQQRALAGAIASFATVLVAEDAPSPRAILARIANKHASLGITEEQYQVVHDYLFEAIVAVLGDAVTPPVARAWDEVYWLLANQLILLERELYAEAGVTAPEIWRTVQVRRRSQESPQSIALVLEAAGAELPSFTPGQYISVAVTLPDGARQIRQYSLSAAPGAGAWRITVKHATDGAGPAGEVSGFLHRNVFEGDELRVSPPFGNVVLPVADDAPLLLISAGIGCTPMISMLDHLVASGDRRPVSVLHADSSPADHAHRSELADLVAQLPSAIMRSWYQDLGIRAVTDAQRVGPVELDGLDIDARTSAYLCGPLPFMQDVRDQLIARQVPADRIRYEIFGPDLWLQAS